MDRKLIFFDVDGTLVGFKDGIAVIAESTVEAIAKLHEKGHLTALATGRSLIMSANIMKKTGIRNAVLHTGARIIVDGRSVYEKMIGPRITKILCAELIKTKTSLFAFDGERVYGENLTSEMISYINAELDGADTIRPFDEIRGRVFSMNAYSDRETVKSLIDAHPSLSESNDYTEIMACGVSKGLGIRRAAQLLGISMRDTIAFGDGHNDADMFRVAGTAIAVGNAVDHLKSLAHHVTDDIYNDGIRNILISLKLI